MKNLDFLSTNDNHQRFDETCISAELRIFVEFNGGIRAT